MFSLADLPKQVDGLVHGLIKLLYGLAGRFLAICLSPVGASAVGAMERRRKFGSETYLFFASLVTVAIEVRGKGVLEALGLSEGAHGSSGLPAFVADVAFCFVSLDLLARGLARLISPKSARPRSERVLRFGLATTSVLAGGSVLVLNMLPVETLWTWARTAGIPDTVWAPLFGVALFPIIVAIPVWPSAAIAWHEVSRKPSKDPTTRVAVFLTGCGIVFVGFQLAQSGWIAMATGLTPAPDRPSVKALSCTVAQDLAVVLRFVVVNPGETAEVFEAGDFDVHIKADGRSLGSKLEPSTLIVSPHEASPARLAGALTRTIPGASNSRVTCTVKIGTRRR